MISKKDENKEYIYNNDIYIVEDELEDIDNDEVGDLLSDMRDRYEAIRHKE